MSKYSLGSLYILPLSLRETGVPPDRGPPPVSPYRWTQRSLKQSQRQCWSHRPGKSFLFFKLTISSLCPFTSYILQDVAGHESSLFPAGYSDEAIVFILTADTNLKVCRYSSIIKLSEMRIRVGNY